MDLPKYQLSSTDDLTSFEFISIGINGSITKTIQFSSTKLKGLYNLAFGDKDETTGTFSDVVISNNGDSEKVLATVIYAVFLFLEIYPNAIIYATGSNKARTRLYRIGIAKYLNEVEDKLEIVGETENGWEKFSRNVDYKAFLVRKNNILH
jgi:hypothetical protein